MIVLLGYLHKVMDSYGKVAFKNIVNNILELDEK